MPSRHEAAAEGRLFSSSGASACRAASVAAWSGSAKAARNFRLNEGPLPLRQVAEHVLPLLPTAALDDRGGTEGLPHGLG